MPPQFKITDFNPIVGGGDIQNSYKIGTFSAGGVKLQ